MKYIPSDVIERLKNLNTENVARKLGMTVNKHRTLCFMHQDTHPSLSFMSNGHGWKCFVCDSGGFDAISFVRKYFQCDYLAACRWLCDAYSISLPNQDVKRGLYREPFKGSWQKQAVLTDADTISFGKHSDIISWIVDNSKISTEASSFLYKERCFDTDIVKNLHIGSITEPVRLIQKLLALFSENDLEEAGVVKLNYGKCYLRIYTPCVLFPYYDVDGNLLALQSRYIGKDAKAPRFQFVGCKKIPIFNLPILKNMKNGEDLYIAEGVTDCIALLSNGQKAVAIPSASNIPETNLRLLTNYRLHMFPDQDKGAGIRAYRTVRSKLISMGSFLYKEELPAGFKDYGEYYQYKRKKGGLFTCND